MPSVQRVHDDLQGNDVIMLAISIDGSGPQPVQSFLDKNGFTMPVAVDRSMELARQFGVRGVPTTFIVNRQGRIVASGFGPVDFDGSVFRTYLQSLIQQSEG